MSSAQRLYYPNFATFFLQDNLPRTAGLIAKHRLIKGWRKCSRRPPYLFPGDKEALKDIRIPKGKKALDFNVLPTPYVGNLTKADIYILMCNPGLKPHDHSLNGKVRKARLNTLRQKFNRHDFAFRSLDPSHEGSDYWRKKFRKIIHAIATKHKMDHEQAARHLSHRLACLDLLPYHSCLRPGLRRFRDLPSVQAMLDFVRSGKLLERARAGKALIIVVRGKKYWEHALDVEGNKKHVVVYDPKSQARNASFGLKSPGGKAIARYLRLKAT
jgi:hypothetical protein